MPESKCGENRTLSMVDHLTKFAIGAALADRRAEGVISALLGRAFFAHGTPRVTLSGNGREFKDALRAEINRISNMRQRSTRPNHPEGNGLNERLNGVISTVIGKLGVAAAGVKLRGSIRNARRLIRGESGKWPERTPEAWYYCDVKTSSPSGVRPYQLVYGRQPNTCLGGRIQKIGNQSDGEDSSGWKPGSDASSLGVQQEITS